MVHKKNGYPKSGELLICTVKKVLPHSIFVDIDEYNNKEGYIHISEIAPGRIRNIRDHVREGKKIVCKVLDINKEKGHIDLSLRRVSTTQRILKNEEYKLELKADKLLTVIAETLKISKDNLYKEIEEKVMSKYDSYNYFLQDVSLNGEEALNELKIPKNIAKVIHEVAKDRIKQSEVDVSYNLSLSTQEPNGITIIKSALKKAEDLSKQHNYKSKVKYISAPKYLLTVSSKDYKSAEKISHELSKTILDYMEKHKGEASVSKIEK